MQKGFWPKINGVVEHIELVKQLLKKQKRHNRDIYVVLLDLKNAFGEVHHSLLKFALNYHHIPQETITLILSQYSNFGISIQDKSANLATDYIRVGRGVLQGDTLSPLLFNLVFNTLMMTLKTPSLQQCGILWGTNGQRTKWSQFADDAAIISETSHEAQTLIHLFQRWTNWADLIIRPDKCYTYGASKINGRYQQILPRLYVNNTAIPPVAIGDSMVYLGHKFTFNEDNTVAKNEATEKMNALIATVEKLQISPTLKLNALNLLMRAHLSSILRQYTLGVTWIVQHLDNIVTEKTRRWLQMPPCSTLHHLSLPYRQGGFGVTLPSQLYEQAQLSSRLSLFNSNDTNMRDVFNQTQCPHIDSFIQTSNNQASSMNSLKQVNQKS